MEQEILFWIGVAAFVLAYGVGVWVWWRSLVRRRERREAHEKAFVTVLIDGVRNRTATTLEDLLNLYRAYFDAGPLDVRDREHVSQLIRRAELVLASQGRLVLATDIDTTLPLLKKCLAENEEVVRAEEKRVPFSGTPAPERQLLEDVLELTAADRDVVRTKLTEIARAISVRHNTIERLGEEGRQSLKWAKLGLLGTVVFSLISIGLAVWALYK